MSYLHWLCCFTLAVRQAHSQWTAGSSTLPEADYKAAVGYHAQTNLVSILGGQQTTDDLIEIDMSDLSMTQITTTPFSGNTILCSAQSYTQISDMLYILNYEGTNIHSYHLDNKLFAADLAFSSMSTTVLWYGCLASSASNNQLFVVGGYNSVDGDLATLQVYDITGDAWSSGPNMQISRRVPTCIVHPDTDDLFAISGYGPSSQSATVEYVNVNNLQSNAWSDTENALSQPVIESRAVMVQDQVWVIGGNPSKNVVHVIHTDYSITLHPERLAVGVHFTAAVVVDSTIYAFGGYNGGALSSWQYYELPTVDPTTAPSGMPSVATYSPSGVPSVASSNPSSAPTRHPTSSPTAPPIQNPTKSPTATPSDAPMAASAQVLVTITVNVNNDTNTTEVVKRINDVIRIYAVEDEYNLEVDVIGSDTHNNRSVRVLVAYYDAAYGVGDEIKADLADTYGEQNVDVSVTTQYATSTTMSYGDGDGDGDEQAEAIWIVGMVVGIIAGCVLISVVVFAVLKRQKYRNAENESISKHGRDTEVQERVASNSAKHGHMELQNVQQNQEEIVQQINVTHGREHGDEEIVHHINATHSGAEGDEDIVHSVNSTVFAEWQQGGGGERDHATPEDYVDADEFGVVDVTNK